MTKARLEKSWKNLLKEYEVPSYAKKYIVEPLLLKQHYAEPILDAGCGTGYFSNLLSARGYKVIAIDKNLDESQLYSWKKIKTNIESFNPKGKKIGDILLINVLSCLEPEKRLAVLRNLKKIKLRGSKIFVINASAKMENTKFKSGIIKINNRSKGLVNMSVKRCDDTFLTFNDYMITDYEFKGYCTSTDLEVLAQQELFFKQEKFPIFDFYILK